MDYSAMQQQVRRDTPHLSVAKRIWILILWTILLCVGTFAASIHGITHFWTLSFRILPHPNWRSFFWKDVLLDTPSWWIAKAGHFIGFGVEEVLIYRVLRKRGIATLCVVAFALMTEVLQLPLGRDGRLYDVLIDTSGALALWWYQSREYYRQFW